MKSLNSYLLTLAHHKRAAILVIVPVLFVLWVVLVIGKANTIRSAVTEKVVAISSLNDLRDDIGESPINNSTEEVAQRKVNVINSLRLSKEQISDSLYQTIEDVYFSNKVSRFSLLETDINAEVRRLRTQLGQDSVRLGSLWNQVTIIGLIACLFAIVSAAFFIKNLRGQDQLLDANEVLRKLNSELEEKGEELATLNETKDRLFAIIGHDLRSPINSLKGLFDMMDDRMISEKEFMVFSAKLRNGVEHVYFALNNLLLWAHAQMQGISTQAKDVTMAPLVKEVTLLLGDFANEKGVELITNIPDDSKVYADPDHLKLIFRNLISNALKFTPKGGSVRIVGSRLDNNMLFSVIDNGIGMSNATLQNLFKRQSFQSRYGTNGEKGTGLGLMLCQDFIEKNKGKVWAESTPNEGSTFHFTIPGA